MEFKKIKEALALIKEQTYAESKELQDYDKRFKKAEKERERLHNVTVDANEKFNKDTKAIQDKHSKALQEELKTTKPYKAQARLHKLVDKQYTALLKLEAELKKEHNELLDKFRKAQDAKLLEILGVSAKENMGQIYVAQTQAEALEESELVFKNSLRSIGVKVDE